MVCERLMFVLLTKVKFLSVSQCKKKKYLFVFVGHPNAMFVSPVYWSKHIFCGNIHISAGIGVARARDPLSLRQCCAGYQAFG